MAINNEILNIAEPIIVPIPMSGCPSTTENIEVPISGALLTIAATEAPITDSGTLNRLAREPKPLTKRRVR
jgi:hypothetical protein